MQFASHALSQGMFHTSQVKLCLMNLPYQRDDSFLLSEAANRLTCCVFLGQIVPPLTVDHGGLAIKVPRYCRVVEVVDHRYSIIYLELCSTCHQYAMFKFRGSSIFVRRATYHFAALSVSFSMRSVKHSMCPDKYPYQGQGSFPS